MRVEVDFLFTCYQMQAIAFVPVVQDICVIRDVGQ